MSCLNLSGDLSLQCGQVTLAAESAFNEVLLQTGDRAARLPGLDLIAGASARCDRCEVSGRAQLPHRGQGRITRIGGLGQLSLRIMRSDVPAAG